MKIEYVIQDIDTHNYWSDTREGVRGYIYSIKFESEEELLKYAKERNIGIFKIVKIYDTK